MALCLSSTLTTFKPTQASFAHTNSQPSHSVLEDFFKVPPSHMKVPPDHYKGPQATSKGFDTLLIPVAAMESSIAPLWSPDSLIIHEQNRPDSRFKVVLPFKLIAVKVIDLGNITKTTSPCHLEASMSRIP